MSNGRCAEVGEVSSFLMEGDKAKWTSPGAAPVAALGPEAAIVRAASRATLEK